MHNWMHRTSAWTGLSNPAPKWSEWWSRPSWGNQKPLCISHSR